MDPGLSVDRRYAPCIGQPVRNLLLRSAKGEHEVRGFVRDVPLAHEPLGFPDVDDVHQGESGVRENIPKRVQAQAPAAHQFRRELIQELANILAVGEIPFECGLHRVRDEAAFTFELVVGEVGHFREHVGHSVAVRGSHQRRRQELRFGEVRAGVARGRFGAADVGEDGCRYSDGATACVRPVVADELLGDLDVAHVHRRCPAVADRLAVATMVPQGRLGEGVPATRALVRLVVG